MRYTIGNDYKGGHPPMNIGIRLHDTAGSNLAEHLAAAKAQGFTCVHLALAKLIPGFSMARRRSCSRTSWPLRSRLSWTVTARPACCWAAT